MRCVQRRLVAPDRGRFLNHLANVTLNAGGGTFILGDPAASLTVTQPVGGVGGLTKRRPGMLVLTASNSYFGTTTVAAGTLQVGNGGTGAVDRLDQRRGEQRDLGLQSRR